MYGHKFLSRRFTDRFDYFTWRFGLITDRFSPTLRGIAPGIAEIWASTGAIWRDVLLVEALVSSFLTDGSSANKSDPPPPPYNADFDRFPLITSQPYDIAKKFNYDE